MRIRILALPVFTIVAAAALVSCSSLPRVVTSTDEAVAVEFDPDDGVASATSSAELACAKFGKMAQFEKVDMTATPDSRIARFKCVAQEDK